MSIEDSSVTSGTRHSPEVTIQVTTAGEVNSGLNVGTGVEVFKDKDAAYLRFRTLEAGAGIGITENEDTVVFDATGVTDAIGALTTDDITETATNKYYSDLLARAAISGAGLISYNSTTGEITFTGTQYSSADFDTDFAAKTTDDLAEGPTNKYYTDTLARAAISGTGDVSYNATSGEISVTTYKTADFNTDFAAATAGKHLLEHFVQDNDGHLLPIDNLTYDIGSATNRIRDLYLGPNTLYMGTDSISCGVGTLNFNGEPLATQEFVTDTLSDGEYLVASALDDYSTTTQMNSALSLKANSADVYTQTAANLLLDAKADAADVYTTVQADALLAGKADVATTYNKTEVDNALAPKANTADLNIADWDAAFSWGNHATAGYAGDAATTAALNLKADQLTTYTKTEVDNAIAASAPTGYNNANWDTAFAWGDHSVEGYLVAADIAGKSDVGHVHTMLEVTGLNSALTAKADVLTTYTKTEVDNAIAAAAPTGYNNANWDTAFGWGNHAVEGYLLPADITGKADTTTVNAALALKANAADVYTTTQTDSLLDTKADELTTYTKTEVDALIGSSGAGHTHDDLYFTEAEIDALIGDATVDGTAGNTITDRIAAAAPTGYNNTNWDTAFGWGDHAAAGYLTAETPETVTSLSLAANILKYTDEDGVETDLDLSLYLDDTNLARLVSADLDPVTNIATFERDDSSSFTIDLSNLAQDLAPYSTTTQMNTAISTATTDMATQTWVNDQAYLTTHQDISGKADTTYVDAQDALKADQATTYTKTEVDALIGSSGAGHTHDDIYYTEAEVDAALALKANTADTYTQAQANTLLDAKANSADVYAKTETYSQGETNALLAGKVNTTGYNNGDWDTAFAWGDHGLAGYEAAADATAKIGDGTVDGTLGNTITDRIATALSSAQSYADTAESDALAAANSYTDGRETAITTAYQTYADTAESDANAYTDARETAITAAYQTYADQAESDAVTHADSQDAALIGDVTVDGTAGNTVTDRIAAALSTANAYTDTAESDANAYTDARETAITTAYQTYADTAESDANAYTDARETAITTAYQTYADTAESDANAYTDTQVALKADLAKTIVDLGDVGEILYLDDQDGLYTEIVSKFTSTTGQWWPGATQGSAEITMTAYNRGSLLETRTYNLPASNVNMDVWFDNGGVWENSPYLNTYLGTNVGAQYAWHYRHHLTTRNGATFFKLEGTGNWNYLFINGMWDGDDGPAYVQPRKRENAPADKIIQLTLVATTYVSGLNLQPGESTTLVVTQNSAGLHGFYLPHNTVYANNVEDVDQTPNSTTYIEVTYDGTTFFATYKSNYYPFYTTGEVDGLLSGKANSATTYNKTEVDTEISNAISAIDVSGKADTTYVDAQLGLKADAADNATQTWVNAQGYLLPADITGKADTTYVDAQLALKADAADNATQTWVNAQGYLLPADITGKADTTYVDAQVAGIVDTAPAALDTLNELAAALGDDPNFATTVSTNIGTKWTEDAAKIANWDAAFGWGDHGAVGYLTAHQDISGKADTTYVDAQLALKSNIGFDLVDLGNIDKDITTDQNQEYGAWQSSNINHGTTTLYNSVSYNPTRIDSTANTTYEAIRNRYVGDAGEDWYYSNTKLHTFSDGWYLKYRVRITLSNNRTYYDIVLFDDLDAVQSHQSIQFFNGSTGTRQPRAIMMPDESVCITYPRDASGGVYEQRLYKITRTNNSLLRSDTTVDTHPAIVPVYGFSDSVNNNIFVSYKTSSTNLRIKHYNNGLGLVDTYNVTVQSSNDALKLREVSDNNISVHTQYDEFSISKEQRIVVENLKDKIVSMTLEDNVTILSHDLAAGESCKLSVAQDATGSRTLTFPANTVFAEGVNTLSTTANAKDLVHLFSDGTTLFANIDKQDSPLDGGEY